MDWKTLFDYLRSRGEPYGITSTELIDKAPPIIQNNPNALMEFWQQKDISHILPTSTHPDLAGEFSNWIPEDPSPNQSRGDDTMDLSEQLDAELDNLFDGIQSMFTALT